MGYYSSSSLSNELHLTIDEYISFKRLSANLKEIIKTEMSKKVEALLYNDDR
jgi:hypothetical protein